MTQQWSKYDATAARGHGKPGREVRPKSTTIDIHSHVAIPQAGAFETGFPGWAQQPGIILGASLIFVGIAEGTFILVAFVLKG